MDQVEKEYERINVPPDIVTKVKEEDAIAQLELGKAYFNATSVENNYEKAFKWISLSAEQGNMEAQFRLGNFYVLGCGTEKSFPDAYKWYTKAAVQGYKKALIRIHNMYQEDIRMHCRGQLHSEEEEWIYPHFKTENHIREHYEYRLEQNRSILNGSIEYYTSQFQHYQSSNQEDPIVQLNLAFLYQHGYGVKKGSRWAFEFYELAANQDNVDAQYNLGVLYQKHTNKKFNYRHAFKWYTKSAQGGNRAAQKCLAYFYLKGIATDINYEIAVSWYTKAAKAGDSEAQLILGRLYRKGDCINQDILMAVKWYTLAAQQGNKVAQNCLAQLYQRGMFDNIQMEGNISEYLTVESMNKRLCSKLSMDISKLDNSTKFKQLNKLVKRACIGDGPSMYEVGLNYYNGDRGFNQDKDTGIQWLKHAANAKHKAAQFMLADLYKKGDSIEQDYHKAAIWYRKTANKKDPQAQCNIGLMYNEGHGVRTDPLEASKWFIWAADQDNSDAQYNLGMLRYQGRGIRKDEKEAVKWLYKSVCQKNIQSCYKLALFYLDGHAGLKKNEKSALTLLEFASRNGHADTLLFLGNKYKNSRYAKFDYLKSIAYYTTAASLGNIEALYKLAVIYINGDGVVYDWLKAYTLLKQAKDEGYENANWLFQIPITYDSAIYAYSEVEDMFIKVTEKGIDDLSYHIGCLHWYRVQPFSNLQQIQKNYTNAEEWFLVAAQKGDSRGDYSLGIMYEFGKGVKQNVNIAVDYYNKAIKKDNIDAMYRLACMYLEGHLIVQDFLEAFRLYTMASVKGHQRASELLMVFQKSSKPNSNSEGSPLEVPEIPINQENRIRMLEKATEEGYTRLQYQLGAMYEENNDDSKAFKWLNLAAKLGITDAYYRVGVFYEERRGVEQDYLMAASMYKEAIKKEHVDAYYRLGRLYQYENGVELDYLKAYDLYKKAAEMGHVMASKSLNITLETKDSLTMYKYVAEHGNTEAQFKVGFAYDHDYSGSNYAEAFKWYSMAASNSHREAMYQLGLLYEHGLGVSQDYYEAIQLYNQAYQLGSDDALFRLAIVYHYGKGVDIDQEKAMKYYITSAELGNPEYQFELGRLYEEGELMQANLLMALKWYTIAYDQGYDKIIPKLLSMYVDNKPYEEFFFEKLLRNLSVASSNHFGLKEEYRYGDFGKINNRLGALYCFGLGTKKNLKQALIYFSKAYSDIKTNLVSHFGFLRYNGSDTSQIKEILEEIEGDEKLINQFKPEKLYSLGIIYYDGIVQTKSVGIEYYRKGYTPIDEQDLNDPTRYLVLEKNHLKAFKYLKLAVDQKYNMALIEPVIFHYSIDVGKANINDNQHSGLAINTNDAVSEDNAKPNQVLDFSKTVEWYNYLEKIVTEDEDIHDWDKKNINTQMQLGWGYLYEYGFGVEKNYKKAKKHYRALVDKNHPMGLLQMGLLYYYGKGVSIDYRKASHLFKKVRNLNSWETKLLFVYDQNDLHTSDSQKRMIFCTKTRDEVKGESCYYLGLMRKYGYGSPKDEKKAQLYFRKALEYGCKRAKNEIHD